MLEHRFFTFSLLASAVAACAAPTSNEPEPVCEGKCDGASQQARPDENVVRRLIADAGRDNTIDAVEARRLAAFARSASGENPRIAAILRALVAEDERLSAEAVEVLRRVGTPRTGDVPLDNGVYRLVVGPSSFLEDDALYLVGDGRVEANTGLLSHSRGYAAKRDGVLFHRHGSLAPHHPAVSSLAETEALRAQGPDVALDAAAKIAGVELGPYATFGAIARSPSRYDTSTDTPDWAGICQGWTHNALDDRLGVLVDPPGTVGARGVWIFGQWLSRADLGNAMMGASYAIGVADAVTIDSFVKPDKLVKALAQHVLRGGVGLRVDIWNDEHNASGVYNPQIWNQPIVAASIEVSGVTPAVRDAVVGHAMRDPYRYGPLPSNPGVKLVRARATWGAETNDAWEGDPAFRASEWNMYFVTAPDGLVVAGYMAHDLVRAGLANLPATRSDGLPDYMAVPRHEATSAAFAGEPHRLLDPSNDDGVRFRFVVSTVLAKGIPEATRAAFEAEARVPGVDADELAERFPGVANAYTAAQWDRVFAPTLGSGERFGATWRR